MYAIYWKTGTGKDLLVEGVSADDLPVLLRAMRDEFPYAYAQRVL